MGRKNKKKGKTTNTDHPTRTLSSWWNIFNEDDDTTTPSITLSAVSPPSSVVCRNTSHNRTPQDTSPTHWASVKIALIKSIRYGIFFDRKYWARHSKAGEILKPIYFSSVIMDDKARQLNNCTSKFPYRYTEALRTPSGKIPQGSKHSRERHRGRCQRRQ